MAQVLEETGARGTRGEDASRGEPTESWRGETLRERRQALALTTAACAAAAGVDEATWATWESVTPPPATRLRAITRVLGCGVEDLFHAPQPKRSETVEDPWLDEELREIERTSSVPIEAWRCDDVGHDAVWSSIALYAARVRAGFTRSAVVDRLTRRGFRVTRRNLTRWERSDENDDPPFRVVRALASILGVDTAAFVDCGECSSRRYETTLPPAEASALAAVRVAAAPRRGRSERVCEEIGRVFRAARLARELSLRAVARAADTRIRDAYWLEQGRFGCVKAEAAMDIGDVLGISPERLFSFAAEEQLDVEDEAPAPAEEPATAEPPSAPVAGEVVR